MANIAKSAVVPSADTADGGYRAVAAFRDGTISTTTFIQRLVAAKMVYAASVGSVRTAITGLTTFAAKRPEIVLRNTSATTMVMPIRCYISLYTSTGGTQYGWFAEVAQNDVGNGTSTAATLGPINLRTDGAANATSVVRYKYTADCTAEVNPVEIWHWDQELVTAAGAVPAMPLVWEPEAKPMLAGLSSLLFYDTATTAGMAYYADLLWAEMPLTWWN